MPYHKPNQLLSLKLITSDFCQFDFSVFFHLEHLSCFTLVGHWKYTFLSRYVYLLWNSLFSPSYISIHHWNVSNPATVISLCKKGKTQLSNLLLMNYVQIHLLYQIDINPFRIYKQSFWLIGCISMLKQETLWVYLTSLPDRPDFSSRIWLPASASVYPEGRNTDLHKSFSFSWRLETNVNKNIG